MIDESSFDDYDRTFFNIASTLAEPFCWTYDLFCFRLISPLTPEKFDNSTQLVVEVAKRFFMAASALAGILFAGTHILLTAVVLGATCTLFRATALLL